MTRLLLIRHGQTTSNVTRSLDTSLPGAALTELGWDQAHTAGERLATESSDGTGPLLVSSQALRARQTAAGISRGSAARGLALGQTAPGSSFAAALTGLQVTPGLDAAGPGAVPGISEIPAGDFEMRSDPDAHYRYHRTFADWLGGSMDLTVPGALNGREVVSRYLDSLLPMVAASQLAGSDLAVVSHGAVIRLIAGYLGRVDPYYAVRTLLPNTSRVELEVPDLGARALPTLPTTEAPMLHTAAWLPEPSAAGPGTGPGTVPALETFGDAVSEGWKVTDWAGHGEPPRVR